MTTWRTYILAGLLAGAAFCRADSTPEHALSIAEYRAELDGLLAATQQLNSSGAATPEALRHLPQSWPVHTEQRDFEISTEGLQRDVRRYNNERSVANAAEVRTRLESLRREIDGFGKAPPEVSAERKALDSILARREFRDVSGPTWIDRLKQWMLERLFRILRRLFRASAIPAVGKYFVYALIGIAGLALLYLVYRSIFSEQEFEEVVPKDLPISAKEWTIWLSEARAAAARGDWRDAIHLAYWAGISFLEREGFWKPDRARTPREYLRLISSQSEQREILTALTRIFELAWYAKRQASEATFSQTLEQLEKLGCR
jgi:Domain of unknown function (DUF4129)